MLLLLGRVARSIDLLKWSNVDEEHGTVGAPRLAVGPDVFGPHVVRQQIAWFGLERFEVQFSLPIDFAGCGRREGHIDRLLIAKRVRDPSLVHTVVIGDLGFNDCLL